VLAAVDVGRWSSTCRAWREVARSQAVWSALLARDLLPQRLKRDEIRAVWTLLHGNVSTPRSPLVDDALATASRSSVFAFDRQFETLDGVWQAHCLYVWRHGPRERFTPTWISFPDARALCAEVASSAGAAQHQQVRLQAAGGARLSLTCCACPSI
jgi:hypothetical protein